MSRFSAENYETNLKLLPAYKTLAQEVRCTLAQLAIAWLLHKAPHIVPILGTTSVAHLHEDLEAVNVRLDPALVARVEALINQDTVAGNRYGEQNRRKADTEEFVAPRLNQGQAASSR